MPTHKELPSIADVVAAHTQAIPHFTRCVDTFIDHFQHVPVQHKNRQDAENYARDLTNRKQCDVEIYAGAAQGKPVDLFRNGQSTKVA